MKQSGFDVLIKNAVACDSIVYAGFSATAVIAFNNLKGLELTDSLNEVPAGYDGDIVWATGIPVQMLKDGGALVVRGNEVRVVG